MRAWGRHQMETSNLWPVLRYHKEQSALWVCPERFAYIACGRQSGKSELALRRLIRYLPIKKDWDNPTYFYSAPTLKQAKRVAWDRLMGLMPKQWITDVSLSDLRIKTVFGSELFLDGLDAPHRIEGQILDGGVIDEASDVKRGTFGRSVLGTLVTRHGWCWTMGVCKRHGVGAAEFRENFEKAASKRLPNSAAFTWRSSGIVSEEELEIAKATMDDRSFDEQYNATWLDSGGGIFYNFSREFNVRPCVYDPNLQIVIGMDFNVSPMAWVLGHIKGDVLEVFDEVWLRNTNTQEALTILLSRYGSHPSGFQIYGDASSRGRHTSAYFTDYQQIASCPGLKKQGRSLHFDKSNPPVADRFAETNARIQSGDGQRRIFVDPSCNHLIEDLEVRAYKLGTREADDSGDIGHPTDALGYIIHKRWPLQIRISTDNKIIITKGAA